MSNPEKVTVLAFRAACSHLQSALDSLSSAATPAELTREAARAARALEALNKITPAREHAPDLPRGRMGPRCCQAAHPVRGCRDRAALVSRSHAVACRARSVRSSGVVRSRLCSAAGSRGSQPADAIASRGDLGQDSILYSLGLDHDLAFVGCECFPVKHSSAARDLPLRSVLQPLKRREDLPGVKHCVCCRE